MNRGYLNIGCIVGLIITIIVLTVVSIDISSTTKHPHNNRNDLLFYYVVEQAYWEGQRDSLTGDVRIEYVNSNDWKWTKSPWDDGRTPLFQPPKKQKKGVIIWDTVLNSTASSNSIKN